MNKKALIAITAILMAGVIAPSFVGDAAPPLPTYTAEEYVSMLPDWSEIDQSEILPHPPDTPEGQLLWQHRKWYWQAGYEGESLISQLERESGQLSLYGETFGAEEIILIYNWMPSSWGAMDAYFIFAAWNITTQKPSNALMYSWETSFIWDDFPRTICDFSIDDLPLEEEWSRTDIGTVAVVITVMAILAVAVYVILKKRW